MTRLSRLAQSLPLVFCAKLAYARASNLKLLYPPKSTLLCSSLQHMNYSWHPPVHIRILSPQPNTLKRCCWQGVVPNSASKRKAIEANPCRKSKTTWGSVLTEWGQASLSKLKWYSGAPCRIRVFPSNGPAPTKHRKSLPLP